MPNIDHISDKMLRLTLRFTPTSMSFSVGDPKQIDNIVYEPYTLNNAISAAANLREAFKQVELLQSGYQRALVMTDSPTLLIPAEEFDEQQVEALYTYAFTPAKSDEILWRQIPNLNAVAVFSLNKDLKMVIDSHFKDIRYTTLTEPVWTHFYKRNFDGTRAKLFAYCYEKKMNVFSFAQNRFTFCNTFEAKHIKDALYYLLYTWKQLGMDPQTDQLYVMGEVEDESGMNEQLERFISHVLFIHPENDFAQSTMAADKRIAYDLKAVYLDEEGWANTSQQISNAQ